MCKRGEIMSYNISTKKNIQQLRVAVSQSNTAYETIHMLLDTLRDNLTEEELNEAAILDEVDYLDKGSGNLLDAIEELKYTLDRLKEGTGA